MTAGAGGMREEFEIIVAVESDTVYERSKKDCRKV